MSLQWQTRCFFSLGLVTMKKTASPSLTLILSLLLSLSSFSALAQSFASAPEVLGELPKVSIPESSGIAYDQDSGRLFHINDSGDGPYVYTTNLDGSNVERWSYDDKDPTDVEDLAIGPCERRSSKRCLYVSDTGDNRRKRSHIRIIQIELSEFNQTKNHHVQALDVFKLEYPDRAHDAESIAVDELGQIYILTKEWSENNERSYASKIFKFDPEEKLKKEPLKFVVNADFTALIPSAPWWGQTPTSMDLNRENGQVAILTYSGIILLKWDDLLAGISESTPHLYLVGPDLPQQEAITFSAQGLIYSTEFVEKYGPANIYLWRYQ